MPIYTKTGDKGKTGLYNKKRVPKDSPIVEALGSIDELNAVLGTIKLPQLTEIQKDLMLINASVAGYKTEIPDVQKLEKEIDRMEKTLPKLKNFILPQGRLHFARAVCRRAERALIKCKINNVKCKIYLNRLSDYLFVLARYVNYKGGVKEIIWKQNS